jgi:ankyrin repeat protein
MKNKKMRYFGRTILMGLLIMVLSSCNLLTNNVTEPMNKNSIEFNLAYALYGAVRNNLPDLAKDLMQHGVTPNQFPAQLCDKTGWDNDQFDSPLLTAVVFGSLETAQVLIDAGGDINYKNLNKRDILMYAAKWRCPLETIQFVLENGVSPIALSDEGYSALDYAVGAGYTSQELTCIIQTLIQYGAKYTSETLEKAAMIEGNHPRYLLSREILRNLSQSNQSVKLDKYLQASIAGDNSILKEGIVNKRIAGNLFDQVTLFCAAFGNAENLSLLLSQNMLSVNKQWILSAAASGNNTETALYLLNNHISELDDKDYDDRTPLQCAVENNHPEMVSFLVGKGAQFREDVVERTELCLAVRSANMQMINLLFSLGYPQDAEDFERACEAAVRYDQLEMVKFLLDKGVSPSSRWVLVVAVQKNKTAILEVLISRGIDEAVLNEALSTACIYSNADTVELLLQDGADPNARIEGMSERLIQSKHDLKKIKILIKYGANVDVFYKSEYAGENNFITVGGVTILKYMLDEVGMDINRIDSDGSTALMLVSGSGWETNFEYILKISKAIVNRQNNDGKTALMKAAEYENGYPQVQMLLDSGADPFIKDNEGQTALDYAKNARNRNSEIINLLKTQNQ